MALRPKLLISAVITISLVLSGLFVFSEPARSDTPAIFSPVSGIDATTGTAIPLKTSGGQNSDIFKLSASDDKRMQTNSAWPGTGIYDENKYLEFVFVPNIPTDTVTSSVSITYEYRRATILKEAKLEIWDGDQWKDISIGLPAEINADLSETKDISSIISSVNAINGLKVRFLAYRDTSAVSATTSHDLVQLEVSYSTPTPTPSDSFSPDASASAMVSPSPSPDVLAIPTPVVDTPTPTPNYIYASEPTPTPFNTLVPTPDILVASGSEDLLASNSFESPSPSPTASPSFSPTPEATPSISLEVTSNPLLAVIVPPKIVYRRVAPIPMASIIPVPVLQSISRIQQVEIAVVNIWHLLTHYLDMIRR